MKTYFFSNFLRNPYSLPVTAEDTQEMESRSPNAGPMADMGPRDISGERPQTQATPGECADRKETKRERADRMRNDLKLHTTCPSQAQ